MEKYINTREVRAKRMTWGEYSLYCGNLPPSEGGAEEGYLVEIQGLKIKNHRGHDGTISWMPKGYFEKKYKPVRRKEKRGWLKWR